MKLILISLIVCVIVANAMINANEDVLKRIRTNVESKSKMFRNAQKSGIGADLKDVIPQEYMVRNWMLLF